MRVLAAYRSFFPAHAAYGPLLFDANEPTATGYEVWAVCVCGAITRSGPHRTGGRASG